MSIRPGFIALLLAALAVSCSAGRSSEASGSTSGTVIGGGRGVEVELACPGSSLKQTTTTDDAGRYAFADVPLAQCTVTPTRAGYRFEPASAALPADLADRPGVDFTARRVLEVYGADMTAGCVNVAVAHAGVTVDDAVVHAGGERIPFSGVTGSYSACLADALAVGDVLSLEVTSAGSTVTGSGSIPEAPTLAGPDDGTYLSTGEDIAVSWVSATSPDYFTVVAQWSCGPDCGTGTSLDVDGSARSARFPAGSLPEGDIQISVMAYHDGVLAGDYEPHVIYPGMNIRSESEQITVFRGALGGRSVSGTVSGAASGGVILDLACAGFPLRTTTSDAQGAYAFDAVPPETDCTVTPTPNGYRFEPSSRVVGVQGDQIGLDFVAASVLQVFGTDIGSAFAHIEVRQGGEKVGDAVVRVNGELATLGPEGRYSRGIAPPLSAGDTVSLEVSSGGATVRGTGAIPEAPLLTSPASGSQLPAGADVTVTWTSVTAPDRFTVAVSWSCGASCGTGRGFSAPGSARTLVLPAAELPPGEIRITVYAYNDGVLSGDYEAWVPYPGMNIRAASNEIRLTR